MSTPRLTPAQAACRDAHMDVIRAESDVRSATAVLTLAEDQLIECRAALERERAALTPQEEC